MKGDDFGAAPENGSKGGSRCEAMICAAACFPPYRDRVILRQFPAAMTTGPFSENCRGARAVGETTQTRDTVNAKSSPFVRPRVGPAPSSAPVPRAIPDVGEDTSRGRGSAPGTPGPPPSPRASSPGPPPLPAGPAPERRGRRHAPVDTFQGPTAHRETPPGLPGAFAQASPSSPTPPQGRPISRPSLCLPLSPLSSTPRHSPVAGRKGGTDCSSAVPRGYGRPPRPGRQAADLDRAATQ
ncbi:hypothetical protein SHXM_08798 [Streptomyces hygroscopicus]|nr:hypothetical protein SHXM_08798 [Streptomyces hygroscopicus]